SSVAFSPNGRLLADGGSDGKVRIWDVSDAGSKAPPRYTVDAGKVGVTSMTFSPGVTSMTFSPDGTLLAASIGDRSHIRQPGGGTSGGTNCVAFSPDSRYLAAGSGDGSLRTWNVATRPRAGSGVFKTEGGILSLCFSGNGRTLILGTRDGPIRLWSVRHREES